MSIISELPPNRNLTGLSSQKIDKCLAAWKLICGDETRVELDISSAGKHSSKTVFLEDGCKVKLGADVYPAENATIANSRMSYLACLSH